MKNSDIMKIKRQWSAICRLPVVAVLVCGCVEYRTFDVTEKPFVDRTSVDLYVGEQAGDRNRTQLESSPANRQYTWTSLDPDVASVDGTGLITAHREGLTTVYIASNNEQTGVSVRVRKYIPLEGFTLNMSSVTGYWQNKFQVMATPVPEDASEVNILWTSSDESVATVYNTGLIKIVGLGTCTVTASAAGITQTVAVTGEIETVKFPRGAWTIPGYTTASAGPQIGYSSHQTSYPLLNLFDGNPATFWHAAYSGAYISNYPHWFIVDMHRTVTVTDVMLQRRQGFVSVNGFYLYTCPDVTVDQNDPQNGYPWELQGEYAINPASDVEQKLPVPAFPRARYILMYFDTGHKTPGAPNNYAQIAEFAVYGYY
jgi:hypothetical protein